MAIRRALKHTGTEQETSTACPVTPDGRYMVVRGRLWRHSNPSLSAAQRQSLVSRLMEARRAVGLALRSGDSTALKAARAAVHETKIGLGERGPVWWSDGAADFNRYLVKNTPYADWYRAQQPAS
jgi:hypothetical protein